MLKPFKGYYLDSKLNVYNKDKRLIIPRIYTRGTITINNIIYTAGELASKVFYNNRTLYLLNPVDKVSDSNVILCEYDWFSLINIRGFIFNKQQLCVNTNKCILIKPCKLYDPITKDSFYVYGFRPNIQIKLKDLK